MFGFTTLHNLDQQVRTLTGLVSSHSETLRTNSQVIDSLVHDLGVLTSTFSSAVTEISTRLDDLEARMRATEARVLGSHNTFSSEFSDEFDK